jgi:hypothetical protein
VTPSTAHEERDTVITRRHRLLAASLVGLLSAGWALAGPAEAGNVAHGGVVSADPANVTPNVVDGGGVDHTAVYAFRQVGGKMYAGGGFAQVTRGGTTAPLIARSNIVAFDATTGAIDTGFAPTLNGPVWAIESSGTSLYVAGGFTQVNGVNRRGVVKLNATTGAVDTGFNAGLTSGRVEDMHLVNGRLLIGGNIPKRLMALNPTDGSDTHYVDISVTGTVATNAGPTDVYRFAVNPLGTRLVAIGNFTAVNGTPRARAFMLDLGAGSATLATWYYQGLVNACAAAKLPAQLRGVDFAPDGSYFVIVATGYIPKAGGLGRDVCDAAARFETNIAAPQRPTWINYTNGDTLHSVVVTGTAIYVQGHNRWLETEPGSRTYAERPGIGALSPQGTLLNWNPGKTRGIGGKVLFATSAGLWVGSDGGRFAGEYRDNIAFCPL